MNILAIDIGTYSLKFYETSYERRRLQLISKDNIVLSEIKKEFPEAKTIRELQLSIIREYLNGEDFEGKIIFQIPLELYSSRYIILPVANKKKANQMLPFQLEEGLPYAVSSAHMLKTFYKAPNNTTGATIFLSPLYEFRSFFLALEANHTLPNFLSPEQSFFEEYAKNKKITGTIAILDIGHTTTKAYFIQDGRIVANHTSFIAGKTIDEAICETYQIPIDEAVIYKHENCFFLTKGQLDKVTPEQKDFALLMERIFSPLFTEFKKWELGLKIRNDIIIEKIFICGGTTLIKNIQPFLMENLKKDVSVIDFFENGVNKNFSLEKTEEQFFDITHLMTMSLLHKNYPPNFLTGDFSISGHDTIPSHSMAFILVRTLIIMFVFLLGIGLENFLIKREEIALDSKINTMLRSPGLEINEGMRRSYRSKPEVILKQVLKKTKETNTEIKILSNALNVNATIPLIELSDKLGRNKQVDLIDFNCDSKEVTGTFFAEREIDLSTLKTRLEKLSISGILIDYQKNEKKLNFSYNL